MPEQVTVLRVVVASPSDVKAERKAVAKVVEEINRGVARNNGVRLEVYAWETEASPGFHPKGPQGLVDEVLKIEACDILVGIFWKRFGTPVSDAGSGTEHEFKKAYEAWKKKKEPHILFYFNQKPYAPKSKEETGQHGMVLDFKKGFPREGLWWDYNGARQLEGVLRDHLTKHVLEMGKPKRKRGGSKPGPTKKTKSSTRPIDRTERDGRGGGQRALEATLQDHMSPNDKASPCALIVTALPVEEKAVRSFLTDMREVGHGSGTIFHEGVFKCDAGNWTVALCGSSRGNPETAQRAERAIAHFEPAVALFVGVAGGLKDVKLGDVVAANKIAGYEAGKQAAAFLARPTTYAPDHSLIERAQVEASEPDWRKRLPASRTARSAQSEPPDAVIAPVASGEKVVANAKSRLVKFLRETYNDVIAVETEGYGFLSALDASRGVKALVVRGISDLLSGKEEADKAGWQKIASENAAAFAFEVLARFHPLSLPRGSRSKNPVFLVNPKPDEPAPNKGHDDEHQVRSRDLICKHLRTIIELLSGPTREELMSRLSGGDDAFRRDDDQLDQYLTKTSRSWVLTRLLDFFDELTTAPGTSSSRFVHQSDVVALVEMIAVLAGYFIVPNFSSHVNEYRREFERSLSGAGKLSALKRDLNLTGVLSFGLAVQSGLGSPITFSMSESGRPQPENHISAIVPAPGDPRTAEPLRDFLLELISKAGESAEEVRNANVAVIAAKLDGHLREHFRKSRYKQLKFCVLPVAKPGDVDFFKSLRDELNKLVPSLLVFIATSDSAEMARLEGEIESKFKHLLERAPEAFKRDQARHGG